MLETERVPALEVLIIHFANNVKSNINTQVHEEHSADADCKPRKYVINRPCVVEFAPYVETLTLFWSLRSYLGNRLASAIL